ncbi:hypothetical protein BGX28_001495 [Mortierella sp. GBA30]|nr:hypothetical protein BGX28_001495 [Mortierella sp. GBA30]
MICPDAYLFEFESEPGRIGAEQEVNTFKAILGGMNSVHIRHEFKILLNGVSAQVRDPDELRQIMSMQQLRMVTPVHPALGKCFGSGCKVAYGYDFVGDAYDGQNKPVPSEFPMDCAGHDTHVAGIIAASDNVVTGVAPQGAYRVFGCNGGNTDDVMLAAIERAVSDNMDIINLSVGVSDGWPWNPIARAIRMATSHGVMVTVSQGNENTLGLFSANYVAEGQSAMAVASIINTRILLSYFTTSLAPNYLYQKTDFPGLNTTLPLVASINGTKLGKGCNPFQADLLGKVVVVSRGDCPYATKAQHAQDRGAMGILFVNNIVGTVYDSIDPVQMASGSMSMVEGQKLFELLKANTRAGGTSGMTADVSSLFNPQSTTFVNPEGGTTSSFSSYGLDDELHIKPDIAAPSENIYSTWLVKNGSYATLSGTSMASPHAAGALALTLQYYRAITGSTAPLTWLQIQQIYDTFKNTAEPTYVFRNHAPFDVLTGVSVPKPGSEEQDPGKSEFDSSVHAAVSSVAKQGSGMMNIFRTLTSLQSRLHSGAAVGGNSVSKTIMSAIGMTHVSPSSLELNDTEFASMLPQNLTIFNYGPVAVKYELSHLPAEAMHELSIESREVKLLNRAWYNVTKPSDTDRDNVIFAKADALVFSASTVSVPAGGDGQVSVRIQAPRVPVGQHWIYSGYIVIRATSLSSGPRALPTHSPSEAIHVPYAGVSGRMKTLPIFLHPIQKEIEANNETKHCQVLGSGITNKTHYVYTMNGVDKPIVWYCICNPTRLLVLDLISGPASDHDDYNDLPRYTVIGKVMSYNYVARSRVSDIVTTVNWNGTLDMAVGNCTANGGIGDSEGRGGSGGRIHREPVMDPMYSMRATSVGDGKDSTGPLRGMAELIQRDVDESKKGDEASPENDVKDCNKITVPDGQYRLRLRGLRMQGDIDRAEDYDVWITRTFTIKRAV